MAKNKEKKGVIEDASTSEEVLELEKTNQLEPEGSGKSVEPSAAADPIVYESIEQWKEDAEHRFGHDRRKWKFKCPACGHIASVQDWIDAGAKNGGRAAFECIGTLSEKRRGALEEGPGPCDYDGSPSVLMKPVSIKERRETYFDFAPGAKKKRTSRKKVKDVEKKSKD